MYFNKISSGTILALLALSGMLFLVPLAVPVHATQNASVGTLTMTPNAILAGGATAVSVKISNPAANAYADTSVTVIAPAGWAFTVDPACAAPLATVGPATASAFQCSGSLPPGFSATFGGGTITPVASPAASPAPQGIFSTTIIDAASTPANYAGPSYTMYSVAAGTTFNSVTPGATPFTAGGAAITVTATLSTNQVGVPIVFSVTTAPSVGFTATVSPSSGSTVAGVTMSAATTSFTPSNKAGDATTIGATIGTSAITMASGLVTTSAGSPSTVGWGYSGPATAFGVGKTFYLSNGFFGTATVAGATRSGEFPAGALNGPFTVAVSDPFLNPIAYNLISGGAGATITISASAGTGFDNGGASLLSTLTCTGGAGIGFNNCNLAGGGSLTLNYFQGYAYGSVGQLTAIITGQFPGVTPFSVSAASGNIVTGTDAASYALTPSAGPYGAGSSVKLTATPNVGTQTGVPVTFNLCGQQTGRTVCNAGGQTTVGYAGSFSNGAKTGYVSNTAGASGLATATYTLDPTLGNIGTWNDTAAAPLTATPTNTLAFSTSASLTTIAGSATTFKTYVYYGDQITVDTKGAVISGQTYYIVVQLVDAYGNTATNPGPSQVQIQLSATGGATLSATTVYIASGGSATNGVGSFGPIQLVIPAAVAIGTPIVLTSAGVVSGLSVSPTTALTDVSALPAINVKSPVPTGTPATIYSSSTGVTFGGWANVSAGYAPAGGSAVTIASVNYKIGSGHWAQASGAGANKDNYLVSLFLPVGLSTIQFNATDTSAAKNVGVTSVYNVLVDTAPPTFTFGSATSNTGCVTVTAATSEGDFNPATFTATWGGVAVATGQIAWSGTQTAGTAGSLTATICGLTSQTATISVTGSTWAGLSSTNSESLTVTVPFADSITFNTGTATYGLVGAFKGVTVSVTNGWNTAQTIVVYATLKSGTSTYVATGTVTLAAGGTASVFVVDLQTVPAGSYTVTFAAVTTSNQAVSAPTTPISVVAT